MRIKELPMPIYEFKCTNSSCNNIEEHFLRHSDPLPTNCEKCASPIEKLVSQTSFALKGSGWYVTDYKGSNPGASSATTNTEPASTESKPAASEPASGTSAEPGASGTTSGTSTGSTNN